MLSGMLWVRGEITMLLDWLKKLLRREPHFIIGDPAEPYLLRWFLIPRNHLFNIYLHKFCRDDIDRALHDHPWASLSIVLRGGYYEITDGPDGTQQRRWWRAGSIILRRAIHRHRVELSRDKTPAWTLFITGPKVRVWGFHCRHGFVPWDQFVVPENSGRAGKGCDE